MEPSLATGPEPFLRLSGVGKRFASGTEALAGLDLTVEPGELLSLLGPSGCGKSTALRLIAGLAEPTSGRIERRLLGPGEIGFVFQEPTLMPWATVAKNVGLPLRLSAVPAREIRRRTAELLERLGLAGFEGAYPRELSGGMKMRVSIARALSGNPRLLLLDEPFAALDEITRGRLNDDLLTLWRDRELTVLFVTHSVYEAAYLSTRIAIFSARPGRVVAEIEVGKGSRDAHYRSSAAYLATCAAVSERLAREVTA